MGIGRVSYSKRARGVSRVKGEMGRRGRGWTRVRGYGKQTVLGLLTRWSICEAGSECGGSLGIFE